MQIPMAAKGGVAVFPQAPLPRQAPIPSRLEPAVGVEVQTAITAAVVVAAVAPKFLMVEPRSSSRPEVAVAVVLVQRLLVMAVLVVELLESMAEMVAAGMVEEAAPLRQEVPGLGRAVTVLPNQVVMGVILLRVPVMEMPEHQTAAKAAVPGVIAVAVVVAVAMATLAVVEVM